MDEHKLKIGLDLDGTINATKKSIKFCHRRPLKNFFDLICVHVIIL